MTPTTYAPGKASAEDINVQEMENTIFESAKAACCTLRLERAPSPELIKKIEESDHILRIAVSEL